MATGRILLPVMAASLPDASAGNAPARPSKVVSTGAAGTNNPKASYYRLLFDQSTDQHCHWVFQCPGDYGSGGTLRFLWGAEATTGNVKWKATSSIGIASTTDMDAVAQLAATTIAATSAPGTVGRFAESTITPTMTGISVGALVILSFGRDADDASDTCAADAWLISATFEYTTL